MSKYTVSIVGKEEWDGELSMIRIKNRAGRTWDSKPKQTQVAHAEAGWYEDFVNQGGKLNPEEWDYVGAF